MNPRHAAEPQYPIITPSGEAPVPETPVPVQLAGKAEASITPVSEQSGRHTTVASAAGAVSLGGEVRQGMDDLFPVKTTKPALESLMGNRPK